jgi:hypothetical protein
MAFSDVVARICFVLSLSSFSVVNGFVQVRHLTYGPRVTHEQELIRLSRVGGVLL